MSTAPKKVISPLRHKKSAVVQKRKKVEDTVSATVNTIVQDLGNPNFLLAAGICAFLAMTHTQDPASSLVNRMAEHLKSSEGSEKIGQFIASHLLQTVGAICFTITTLLCAPKDKTGTWIVVGLAFAFLVPEKSAYQYAVQCIALSVYLRAKRKDVRAMIIVAACVSYVLGFVA
ncbi:hypothetical protein AACV_gp2 [Anopheline-associated C virus]|uniref:hypothetical protein n=1 Tax=Anopheline-associated C virus TaxID=1398939 RepID=UPI0003B03B1E|nr:hypothetical protein AACV_gp2 [Anopheline-associated C virus]AGW51754.1 hypothetical protein [Anopheline-associated C virus]AGW51776.1 hypothetical protein [Anopheline-associated C virus]